MTPKGWKRGLVTAGALLLGLAVATSSWAQGMFYKEIKKDGRIYVFNNAKSAAAFEASGETGVGLTRIGVGPNGESVFADNETALELFFFKYGIAEVVEKPKPPVQTVVWRDGKTRFTLGSNFYMEMSNRVQVRYTHVFPDDAVQLPGTKAAGDSQGSFRIRRAKFKLEGWFYKKQLTYEVQMNWPAAVGSNVGAFLEDANLDWDASNKGVFRIKLGQFKYPQSRQELTSSGSQEFVDRSLVENRYGLGRDLGLQLWGSVLGNKLEWRAGVFNGNGLTRAANDNDKFLLAARVQVHPNGNPGYSEVDFESRDKVLWAVGGFASRNDVRNTTTGNDFDFKLWGFDAVVKKSGVFLTGTYYSRDTTPETGGKFEDKGWFAQGGYLFAKQHWELAFRYGEFDPSGLVVTDKQKEVGGALSYYYNKHNLKVQADYRQVKSENAAGDRTNNEVRLQTQFIF